MRMPTVGEILSAERRRQGKSLADAVDGTKIRSRLLDALEKGRYDDLPSPAYVKGFIQSYARFLEIPAPPLLEQYKVESAGTVRRLAPADRYLSEIPTAPLVPRRDTIHEIPRNVWIGIAIGVVALIIVLLALTSLLSGGGSGANTTPPTVSGAPTTTSPGATPSAPATSVTTSGAGFKLRISIRTGLASYVNVTVDGLNGYTGTLQGGESREFQVTSSAQITIGQPSAVVVTRDGTPVSLPTTANAHITLKATAGQ
jgi:cytoskeletal protein RodZ